MTFTTDLKAAAAATDLSTFTDRQWGFVQAMFGWMRSGATLEECEKRLQALVDDPIGVANVSKEVNADATALIAALADPGLRDAILALRPDWDRKVTDFRAARVAEDQAKRAPKVDPALTDEISSDKK